ncbi:hypothetical protein ASPWEDRAFT_51604 [Aspergillus wentii DTO 134E9]|uniref:Uncharacterized protein n=1 Tax=Aspergillus wentii DTO 134E9 TaxID=1073089 RepID=A0A1L9RL05_ASPWE|nr:uncharacterized protein ASPWEDRAFT_51604 [Aspergillus wentii DTO 134E9]OJJ35601.1 hypothetical protein ASPWEDRAFT_51604 [Aspergillus wentii DTO 134E9]
MHLSLEHVDACLPITTLKALVLRDTRLVIQGQGPYARLIDEASGNLLAELKTFKRNNAHGFIILDQKSQDAEREHVQLIAWGGQSLRVIDLFYARNQATGASEASFSGASAEYLAPDWMLAGCASCDNSAGVAYMVTAHNALLGLRVVDGGSSRYEKAIHLQQLVTGVKSILYSADAISISASHVLITAGTVFGEIIVWSCFIDSPESLSSNAIGSIHHFFTGHEGSIFGVRISPQIPSLQGSQSGRLLASCSDDRTVRIWDISDCERTSREDPSAYSTDGFELRSTGFGVGAAQEQKVGSESCVAKAFGHLARIWSVHFLPTIVDGQRKLSLISRGEDATCLLWALTWDQSSDKTNYQIRQKKSFHHHAGKHIWSLDMCSTETKTVVYTGGADGAIRSFSVELRELIDQPEAEATRSPKSEVSLKTFAFVAPDCFLATSFKGEVQIGWVESETETETKPQITRETLFVEDDLRSFSIISSLPGKGLALLGTGQGLIKLYNHATKSLSKIAQTDRRPLGLYFLDTDNDSNLSSTSSDTLSFITSYGIQDRVNLFMVTGWDSTEPSVENITLTLPPTFEVTCASFLYGTKYVALGSKSGGLVIYQVSNTGEPLQPLLTMRRVHGDLGTNKIMPFLSVGNDNGTLVEYVFTSGRDGNYCVHEIEPTASPETPIRFQTVHQSSTSMGQDISGAYFDKTSQDLMIYGYRGKEFVLWNESTQAELAKVDCGGARRSWAFQPSGESAHGALFLWNQAATFYALRIPTDSNRPLRIGGHGREIKSMEAFNSADGKEHLYATGAEDTAVRLFAPTPSQKESPWGAFKCQRVLKKHTTGLQQVSWSKDGRFLFTSAGYEEFFVWRVRSIPRFGVAAIHVASSPLDELNSDLRITSFDMLDVGEGSEHGFLLCLTYSNSTMKIFHYSSSVDAFTLLAKGTYTSNCLTQAKWMLKDSSVSLVTASTDGYFTLWNLTSVLEPFYSVSSSTLAVKQLIQAMKITPEHISCESRYQIHSNSIKALELIHLSETASLIVAGGDDNSLSLSLLVTDLANSEVNTRVSSITIPDAHAASVTTIKILEQKSLAADMNTGIIFASSGNDHRVKVWSVDVDTTRTGADAITARNLVDRYSSVADISSLDAIQSNADDVLDAETKLLVCGVGMEMLSVRLD